MNKDYFYYLTQSGYIHKCSLYCGYTTKFRSDTYDTINRLQREFRYRSESYKDTVLFALDEILLELDR